MKLRFVLGLLSAVCTLAWAESPKSAPATYAPLPEAVTSFGAVVHGGWMYIYGGHLGPRHEYSSNEVTGVCRRLNLADGVTWETLASGIPAQSPGLVAKGKYLYRIGGMAARNPKGEKQDTFSHDSVARLDLLSNTWDPLPNLPEPRSSHDAWIVGDKLYVAGGWKMQGNGKKSEWLDNTLSLDLTKPDAQWERLDQPFKRRGICMAAVGTKLYCIGGMDAEDATSSKVDVLDTATGTWSVGPMLPPGRFKGFAASACTVEGRLYFNGFSGVVYRLSTAGDDWEEVGKVPTPRLSHRILPASPTRLIAVGGEGSEGKVREIEIVELAPKSAGVWPNFRGVNRDGISTEPLLTVNWPTEGPKVLWRAQAGRGLSAFAVSADTVFTLGNTNDTDTLWAFNAADGLVRWRYDYRCATTNHPMPVVPYGPASTPSIVDGKIYSLSREGDFFCLNATTGELVWQKHLLQDLGGKRPVYGYANSPLIAGGRVYLDVGGTNGSTVALEAATGEVIWRAGKDEAGYSSPRLGTLGGKPVLAIFKGEAFKLLSLKDGSVIAEHATTVRDFCNTITPALAGATAFISNTGKDGTSRVDFAGATPRVVWNRADLGMLFSSPVLWQGRLYAFNDAKRNENEFLCVDAATGETVWSFGEVEKGGFILADGKALVFTRQCELVVFSLDGQTPKVLSRSQPLGGKSYAEPVLAEGRVYLRNNDGQIVCLNAR